MSKLSCMGKFFKSGQLIVTLGLIYKDKIQIDHFCLNNEILFYLKVKFF